MADDAAAKVRDADIRGLAAKLKGLYALLTPAEQVLLRAVLRRAAGRGAAQGVQGAPADVWAVGFNPFPYLDAIAAEEIRGEAGSAPRGDLE